MKLKNRTIVFFLCGFFNFWIYTSVNAIELKAEISSETISFDDSVILTLILSGNQANLPSPDIGSITDFEAWGRGQSQQMSISNGEVKSESIFKYELKPQKTGSLTIPALSVTVDGVTYSSKPINVIVTESATIPTPPSDQPPNALPTGNEEVILQSTIEPKEVFVGQQAKYCLHIYRRIRWDSPRLDEIKFDRFWVEELEKASGESRANIAGQPYLTQDVCYALFAGTAGTYDLTPAVLHYSRLTEGDFFFAIPQAAPPVQSNPVHLTVLDIPLEGRPADFQGIVGDFKINASIDQQKTSVDKPITLTVIVSGVGNPEAFTQPAMNIPESVEQFETKTDKYSNKKTDMVSGSKIFKTVLVPREPGSYEIGPFSLKYFDPFAKEFKEIHSEKLELTVIGEAKPKASSTPLNVPPNVDNLQQAENIKKENDDIFFWRTSSQGLVFEKDPLARKLFWGILLAMPILLPLIVRFLLASTWKSSRFSSNYRRRVLLSKSRDAIKSIYRIEILEESVRKLELVFLDIKRSPSLKNNAEISSKIDEFLHRCQSIRFSRQQEKLPARDSLIATGIQLLDMIEMQQK